MKFSLVTFFVALLMFGCSDSPKTKSSNSIDLENTEVLDKIIEGAIYDHKLQKRGDEGEELVYLTNKQTPYTGWVKKMWENGQVKELGHFKNGELDGLKNTWYENGQKATTSNRLRGEVNGLFKRWSENGNKLEIISYKTGVRDGLWTEWYENGQKKWEGNFKEHKKDGLETLWYENGQKKRESFYKNGKGDGPCRHWFENGKIQVEHTIRNDKENGLRTEWYKTEDKRHEVYYDRGRWMSALSWKPDGKKCPVTNLVKGNGLVVLYNEDGTESMRSTFENGYGVKPTVAEAKNTKDDKFKQMILEDIDKALTSKKPIGSKLCL